jgi:hypothetical protein
MISIEDFMWFLDDALDDLVDNIVSLGDELANRAPDLPGANSPFALLTHCLGVVNEWGGRVIAGREIDRHRASEFVATGAVADLAARARQTRDQLVVDLANFDASAAPRGPVDPDDAVLPLGRTQGGALFHIYEELSHHRGHMELTRDFLLAS